MGILGKFEVEVDIKSCGDLFYELFRDTSHHVSNIVQDYTCELHEGDFGKPGAIVSWGYIMDGKKCVAKEILEVVDNESKLLRFKVIDGDVLEVYKTMLIGVQVIPKGDVSGVKWLIEFKKLHDDGPYPTKLLDFLIGRTRDIEAYHLKE